MPIEDLEISEYLTGQIIQTVPKWFICSTTISNGHLIITQPRSFMNPYRAFFHSHFLFLNEKFSAFSIPSKIVMRERWFDAVLRVRSTRTFIKFISKG